MCGLPGLYTLCVWSIRRLKNISKCRPSWHVWNLPYFYSHICACLSQIVCSPHVFRLQCCVQCCCLAKRDRPYCVRPCGICCRSQIFKLPVLQFFQFPVKSSYLDPYTVFWALFSNTFIPCSSLSVSPVLIKQARILNIFSCSSRLSLCCLFSWIALYAIYNSTVWAPFSLQHSVRVSMH
jgi:hypothetical protein